MRPSQHFGPCRALGRTLCANANSGNGSLIFCSTTMGLGKLKCRPGPTPSFAACKRACPGLLSHTVVPLRAKQCEIVPQSRWAAPCIHHSISSPVAGTASWPGYRDFLGQQQRTSMATWHSPVAGPPTIVGRHPHACCWHCSLQPCDVAQWLGQQQWRTHP